MHAFLRRGLLPGTVAGGALARRRPDHGRVDFNVVRLAEFAWSKIEPNEGHYDFDSLDRAITLLASYNMRVVLGTPTASPPPWPMTKYLAIFRVREDGVAFTFGDRREYCPNNPIYHANGLTNPCRSASAYRCARATPPG